MILIDPPVNPLSEPAKIRAWIGRLSTIRRKAKPADRATVDRHMREAQDWLAKQLQAAGE